MESRQRRNRLLEPPLHRLELACVGRLCERPRLDGLRDDTQLRDERLLRRVDHGETPVEQINRRAHLLDLGRRGRSCLSHRLQDELRLWRWLRYLGLRRRDSSPADRRR
jgi:hypothetical protein